MKSLPQIDYGMLKQAMKKKSGAICKHCHQDMTKAESCTFGTVIDSKGKKYRRYRYGDEGGDTSMPCGDCGVHAGGVHHDGCDLEDCPKCHGQFAFCDCDWKQLSNG